MKASQPNSLLRISSLGFPGLLVSVMVFFLLLPNTDIFISRQTAAPDIIRWLVPMEPIREFTLYGKLACVVLGAVAVATFSRWSKMPGIKTVLYCTALVVIHGLILLVANGDSLVGKLRSGEVMGFYLVALATVTGAFAMSNRDFAAGIMLGTMGAALIRLLHAVYAYRLYGGIQVVEGVSSLAMDGALLALWILAGSVAGLLALDSLQRLQTRPLVVALILGGIFTIALAASYRRATQFWLMTDIAVGTLAYFWMKGRFAYGLAWVTAAVALMSAGLFAAAVVRFGFVDAYERVMSVTTTGSQAYSFSNDAYIEDWNAWPETLIKHHFLGTGPGLDYGVGRLVQVDTESGDVIPLHVGLFELWASMGISGAIYHVVCFLVLPFGLLRRCRTGDPEMFPFAAVSFSFLIFVGLWPFAPPISQNFQTAVLIGMCFGCLIACAEAARVKTASVLQRRIA